MKMFDPFLSIERASTTKSGSLDGLDGQDGTGHEATMSEEGNKNEKKQQKQTHIGSQSYIVITYTNIGDTSAKE